MKLTELDPSFLKVVTVDGEVRFQQVSTVAEADGLVFLCPVCKPRPGCHSIICWSPKVPREIGPGPGRWAMSGHNFTDLTLTPSIHILNDALCGAHFFITNGEIK